MKTKVMFWTCKRDKADEYRVHARARNGRKSYASTEGYKRKGRAITDAVLHGCPPEMRTIKTGTTLRYEHRVVNGRLC